MGRRRKAGLWGGDGKRFVSGKRQPGLYVRFYEYAAGQRIQRTKQFTSRRLAEDWLGTFNARIDLDQIGQLVPISLADAAREFLSGCGALARDTRTHYSSALAMFTTAVGESVIVASIHGRQIDAFVGQRSQQSKPAIVAKHVRALRRFFR